MSTSIPDQTRLLRHTLKALENGYTGAADDEIEDEFVAVEVLITFNHDWERHILVQSSLKGGWTYSLWHVDGINMFTLVKVYPAMDDRLPAPGAFIDAATVVEGWKKTQHYSGQSIDAAPCFQ